MTRSFYIFALMSCLAQSSWAEIGRQSLEQALVSTETAMNGLKARGDVIFMTSQAGLKTGRKMSLFLTDDVLMYREVGTVEAAEYALWSMRDKRLPLVNKSVTIPLDEAVLKRVPISIVPKEWEIDWVVGMMGKAETCSARLKAGDLVGEPYYGYIATHQVLALMLAKARGCIDEQDFKVAFLRYVSRMYSEMLAAAGEKSDVQVERIAFMGLIGRIDLVPERMLDELISDQWYDGFWYFDSMPEHTTALAYLALSAKYGLKVDQ